MALPAGAIFRISAWAVTGKSDGDTLALSDVQDLADFNHPTELLVLDTGGSLKWRSAVDGSAPAFEFDRVQLSLPNILAGLAAGELFVRLKANADPAASVASSGSWFFGAPFHFQSHYPYTDGNIYESFGSSAQYNAGNPSGSLTNFRSYHAWAATNNRGAEFEDEALVTSSSNTVAWPSNPRIGHSKDGARFAGQIVDLIIFDRILSSSEREDVFAELGTEPNLSGGPVRVRVAGAYTLAQQARIREAGAYTLAQQARIKVAGAYTVHGPNRRRVLVAGAYIIEVEGAENQRPSAPTLDHEAVTKTSFTITRTPGVDPEEDPIVATRLQIATSSDFTTGIFYDSGEEGEEPTEEWPFSSADPDTLYYYRAADADAEGFGDWSSVGSLTTLSLELPTPDTLGTPESIGGLVSIPVTVLGSDYLAKRLRASLDPTMAEYELRDVEIDVDAVVIVDGPFPPGVWSFQLEHDGVDGNAVSNIVTIELEDPDRPSAPTISDVTPTHMSVAARSSAYVGVREPLRMEFWVETAAGVRITPILQQPITPDDDSYRNFAVLPLTYTTDERVLALRHIDVEGGTSDTARESFYLLTPPVTPPHDPESETPGDVLSVQYSSEAPFGTFGVTIRNYPPTPALAWDRLGVVWVSIERISPAEGWTPNWHTTHQSYNGPPAHPVNSGFGFMRSGATYRVTPFWLNAYTWEAYYGKPWTFTIPLAIDAPQWRWDTHQIIRGPVEIEVYEHPLCLLAPGAWVLEYTRNRDPAFRTWTVLSSDIRPADGKYTLDPEALGLSDGFIQFRVRPVPSGEYDPALAHLGGRTSPICFIDRANKWIDIRGEDLTKARFAIWGDPDNVVEVGSGEERYLEITHTTATETRLTLPEILEPRSADVAITQQHANGWYQESGYGIVMTEAGQKLTANLRTLWPNGYLFGSFNTVEGSGWWWIPGSRPGLESAVFRNYYWQPPPYTNFYGGASGAFTRWLPGGYVPDPWVNFASRWIYQPLQGPAWWQTEQWFEESMLNGPSNDGAEPQLYRGNPFGLWSWMHPDHPIALSACGLCGIHVYERGTTRIRAFSVLPLAYHGCEAPVEWPAEAARTLEKAWAFVLDGHVFYVLNRAEEGRTYICDLTTGQWFWWFTAEYAFWNMFRGIMWKGRVVAADNYRPIVWQVEPNSELDEGIYQIARAASGFVPVRGKESFRVGSLRVTASVGHPEASDAVLRMRFSDDGGNTWSRYYDLPLIAGAYEQRAKYRSLGRMRAPGRLYEFTDVGGLVRIEGADATMDEPGEP